MSHNRRNYNEEWLPSVFNDLFTPTYTDRKSMTDPAINIIESNDAYKVEVAVPGMTKEDFNIQLDEDNNLVLSVEKKQESEEPAKETGNTRYLRREFTYAKSQKTLILPDDVDIKGIKAKAENGVLTINLPKKQAEPEPKVSRNIQID